MTTDVWTPAASLRKLGRAAESVARHAGQMAILLARAAAATASGRVSLRAVADQAYEMGVRSLPLVLLTGALAGVVTAQQGGYQFSGGVPIYVLGNVVTSSIILELGPVLTAFVLIGRVGARITAELGTMQVSEQIDAMLTLGRDPVRSLAAPRLLAGLLVTPLLVGLADATGSLSGMLAAQSTLGLGRETFLYGARMFWHSWDFFYSLAKATSFGFAIPLISVHMGLQTSGGAAGVGHATTGSVVFMIITVLVLDALFPPLLLS
jgi:phospholipid/cholesterol/gamma-HCH transport system permease protein